MCHWTAPSAYVPLARGSLHFSLPVLVPPPCRCGSHTGTVNLAKSCIRPWRLSDTLGRLWPRALPLASRPPRSESPQPTRSGPHSLEPATAPTQALRDSCPPCGRFAAAVAASRPLALRAFQDPALFRVLCTCDARFSSAIARSPLSALPAFVRPLCRLVKQLEPPNRRRRVLPATHVPPPAGRPSAGQPSAEPKPFAIRSEVSFRFGLEQ
jgi:hypothetical protein